MLAVNKTAVIHNKIRIRESIVGQNSPKKVNNFKFEIQNVNKNGGDTVKKSFSN